MVTVVRENGRMTPVADAAYDRRWRQAVALKTLHRQDPKALLRLKQEFRVLADRISEPDLRGWFERQPLAPT